jgi:hypothetical protein
MKLDLLFPYDEINICTRRHTLTIASIFCENSSLSHGYRVLVEKSERKKKLGRPRSRLEDNIKLDLQEVRWGLNWMNVAQNMDGAGFLCMS